MNRICTVVSLLFLLAGVACAQDPFHAQPRSRQDRQPSNQQPDDQQYETPRQLVQRKAAWKAAQRRQRLEAMKWQGYSPLRPTTSPLPFMGSTSPWLAAPPIYYGYPGRIFVYSAELPALHR